MFQWLLHKLKGDKIIWVVAILISLVGLLAVYSASSAQAFRLMGGDREYYLLKHAMHLGLGLLIMYLVHLVNYRMFARLSNVLLLLTIPLLLYTIVRGSELNEAARWISVFGTSFQPSDLAKLTLIVYLARLLTQRQDVIKDFTEGFLPALFWVTIICGLIAPSDLSTATLMFISSLMVMIVAGVDLKYIGVLVMVAILGLGILSTTAKRAETWRSRWDDYVERLTNSEYDGKFETVQTHIAIASSGLLGKGVGKSTQRNFLPHANTDFVFAIIVEEYGLVGALGVLGLYLLLLFRAVSIATVSKTFGALTAGGLAFLMVMQALIHMGVTVGLLPLTGLTLPLVSMGGTSIMMTCVSLGIILSVSRDAIEKGKTAKDKPSKWKMGAVLGLSR